MAVVAARHLVGAEGVGVDGQAGVVRPVDEFGLPLQHGLRRADAARELGDAGDALGTQEVPVLVDLGHEEHLAQAGAEVPQASQASFLEALDEDRRSVIDVAVAAEDFEQGLLHRQPLLAVPGRSLEFRVDPDIAAGAFVQALDQLDHLGEGGNGEAAGALREAAA